MSEHYDIGKEIYFINKIDDEFYRVYKGVIKNYHINYNAYSTDLQPDHEVVASVLFDKQILDPFDDAFFNLSYEGISKDERIELISCEKKEYTASVTDYIYVKLTTEVRINFIFDKLDKAIEVAAEHMKTIFEE